MFLSTRELADKLGVSLKRIRTAATEYDTFWNRDEEFRRWSCCEWEYKMTPEFIFFLSSWFGKEYEDSTNIAYKLLAEVWMKTNGNTYQNVQQTEGMGFGSYLFLCLIEIYTKDRSDGDTDSHK